jgi:transcription termination factor Rho
VSGDVVTGPVRRPRRSERYPSLVRVDAINGTPADEVAEGTRYEDLPAAFPEERFALGSEEPTVRVIEWLTPFGKGSRVAVVGAARAGKTEALLRLAAALAAAAETGGHEVSVVLAGVRPEEIARWQEGPAAPAVAVSFAASADAQIQAVESAVEQGRRRAARGSHVVLLIDSLDAVTPSVARRAMSAARNIVGGGSLTMIATSHAPLGGETTVIALDEGLAGTRRYPALDLRYSGVVRPEMLVGEEGADAIAKARAEALGI